MRIRDKSMAIVLLLLIVITPSIWAQWVDNGIPIHLSGNVYTHNPSAKDVSIIDDGSGGAIVVWSCAPEPSGDSVFVQAVDPDGHIRWTENGKRVSIAPAIQQYPIIAPDGSGGAFVFWADARKGTPLPYIFDLYGQRIDEDGIAQWSNGDVSIMTSNTACEVPVDLVPDGAGGSIVIADDLGVHILAQRVAAGGSSLWTADGVVLATAITAPGIHVNSAESDGGGGAIIVFHEYEDEYMNNADLYVQRVDLDGNLPWGSGGIVLCNASDHQLNAGMVSDGAGGAIIAWEDHRSGDVDIYAQRINTGGVSQWTTNGIPICEESGDQDQLQVISDGAGGAILVWADARSGKDIYAQRIDSDGNSLWTASGEAVCTATGDQEELAIVSDGSGGVVVSWTDSRVSKDIYAQRIDADGNTLWMPDGMMVCDADQDQYNSRIASNGSGGAVIAWMDKRNFTTEGPPEEWYLYPDLFAQTISGDGYPGDPSPQIVEVGDVPDDQGGKISVIWNASTLDEYPFEMITHYSVWRLLSSEEASAVLNKTGRDIYLSEGGGIEVDDSEFRVIDMGSSPYIWEWIADTPARRVEQYAYTVESLYDSMGTDPHWQYFVVSAETDDPFTFWDSSIDSGYSVDNLSPEPPLAVAAEQSYSPEGLILTWDSNTESDLLCYNVYRGLSEDFVTEPGNLIGSPSEPTLFDDEWRWDSGFYYKVTAADVHGNESSPASPTSVTGDDTPDMPKAFALYQNAPNPFNPSTVIRFDLPRPAYVRLSIYSVKGELVATLVDGQMTEGRKEITWIATGNRGGSVVSGIYFYRLTAGDFTQTRKMVLLR